MPICKLGLAIAGVDFCPVFYQFAGISTTILILGDDLAACIAAHEIRKVKRREEVIIVSSSRSIGYSRLLLPYYAAGFVEKPELIPRSLVEVIDLASIVSCSDVTFSSDHLTIKGRTYVKPRILVSAWPSMPRGDTINLLRPEDADHLRDALQAAKEIVVAGGPAALPVVDALTAAGWKVSLVWRSGEFDSDIEAVLIEEFHRSGVRLVSELPPPSSERLLINFGGGAPPSVPLAYKPLDDALPVDSSCRVIGSDFYALGTATAVVEPEGFKHAVRCEEEAILQAMNFAAHDGGLPHPPLRRYFVARYGGRVYATFGLTMREAEASGYDAAATRIRGWGRCRDAVLKVVASREGGVLGVQAIIGEDLSWALGLLYFVVLAGAKLHEVSRAIGPIDPRDPTFEGLLDKAFRSLLRKCLLRRAARVSQRFDAAPGSAL